MKLSILVVFLLSFTSLSNADFGIFSSRKSKVDKEIKLNPYQRDYVDEEILNPCSEHVNPGVHIEENKENKIKGCIEDNELKEKEEPKEKSTTRKNINRVLIALKIALKIQLMGHNTMTAGLINRAIDIIIHTDPSKLDYLNTAVDITDPTKLAMKIVQKTGVHYAKKIPVVKTTMERASSFKEETKQKAKTKLKKSFSSKF